MDTWSNLCRCCLSPDSEVSILGGDQNVEEKFLETTSIEVKADDGLPQRLCSECYSIMTSAYQFRKQCIKMDSELKVQLNALLTQVQEDQLTEEEGNDNSNKTQDETDLDEILALANDPFKQLERIIKKEPSDSDDDCYYVVVIDSDKGENNQEELHKITNKTPEIKQEVEEQPQPIKKEMEQSVSEQSSGFDNLNSLDLFIMSNQKVPINVPATILENEEEEQDMDTNDNGQTMDIDEPVVDNATKILSTIEDSQDGSNIITGDLVADLDPKSLIKIVTGTDGRTILLKTGEEMQYLTGTELVASNDGDQDQEEVIYCDADEASQYQILKYDGAELVIEYSDDGQIATIVQQEDGKFVCECGDQFEDLGEYEKHQFKHNPGGEHLCNLCGKGFESSEILTGHMLLHKSTGLLITCPFCNQLIKRNTLTQHIKYGHNNIKPRCSVCFKTFANPNNLKRHMMIHSGVREFECDICSKRFHQKITMQVHRLTHINPFACNQCDKTFENKVEMNAHKESDECSKSKVKKVKEELMKTVKQEVTTNHGLLLGYACSLCKKMFSVESALEQHVESTHISDPMELLCSECGEVLPSKKDMQIHMMTHKNIKNKTTKRFECSICSKGCSSQAMLIMHERVHTNERPFPCQLCALRFKTKTHLRTHQLTHTREKKFGCSVCMKFFALKGNLVVHLRTHTGERPYVCTLCGEAFIDSKYLKKHKLKRHAIENVPWNKY
ncbi:zinc finger protein 585A [Amyelois transitella]|uniref:zinc finger protein 585A n=1 Tax=Amyelois transitella TaxID=680683 RepID=UPI00067BC6AB|nr:zinc finger protein 585A [Amyelois transitella]XP_013191868.1 zinc finger protein 585A [Amyelois transitella]